MWETVHIIQNMGVWKPKYFIWENVKNVLSRHMKANVLLSASDFLRSMFSMIPLFGIVVNIECKNQAR